MGSNKIIDSKFQGAGSKFGLEIWCVDSLHLVPVPQPSHGKFFSGSAYIVLHTALLKSGALQQDIHYWLGKDANEVDSDLASDKTLELDATLRSKSIQYKEVQGQETGKFLSYFKPCIIPVEGIYSSGQIDTKGPAYKTKLLTCKGDCVVHVKEPLTVEPKLYEEGRGKVAAMFKQTGYDVDELPDEDEKSHIVCNDLRKFYSGNCYTVQYIYSANGREERLFYIWIGNKSSPEDRADAITLTNVIVSIKESLFWIELLRTKNQVNSS